MINFATPLSQIGTGRTSSGNYNQKFILNSQGQKVMTDDTTRPIGQDAMGRKIVGARSMSGMAGLGGVTNVPNAAAPGYGGYRGTMQGSHIDANTTPGGVTPDYGPIGESSGPLSPDYGDGALGQIKAGSAMSSMGVDLAGSRANSQAESARRQNEQWKGTPYYQPPFGGFRRKGGPMQRGQAYVVGENGPELVVPNQSGTVIPAGATERIMRPRSAFDKMYARKAIDPLTGMSYAPSSRDISRKRLELQKMGDMEALAEFDNLIQSRSSGNPYAQSSAEDSFRRFRAARQYAGKMVTPQRQPEFTNQQPTTMPQQDVAPPIPSYQSGTVTQTPLGRVLHGSVYGTGSSTLMPKPYAPPQAAPELLRAPADYSGVAPQAGSLDRVMGGVGQSLLNGSYKEIAGPPVSAKPMEIAGPPTSAMPIGPPSSAMQPAAEAMPQWQQDAIAERQLEEQAQLGALSRRSGARKLADRIGSAVGGAIEGGARMATAPHRAALGLMSAAGQQAMSSARAIGDFFDPQEELTPAEKELMALREQKAKSRGPMANLAAVGETPGGYKNAIKVR